MTGGAREKPHAGSISADGRGQRLTEECSDQRKPKRLQHRELGSAPLRDDLPARGGQNDLDDERRLGGDNPSQVQPIEALLQFGNMHQPERQIQR